MPYIDPNKRSALEFEGELPITPGDLNYAITSLCHRYIAAKGKSYGTLNEVIGVIESAKLELYRAVAAPYEDDKRDENGPVSDLDLPVETVVSQAPAVDAAGIVAALTKALDERLGVPKAPARRRKPQEPPVPPPTASAASSGNPAPVPPRANTSSVRRPAQVIGQEPGEEEAPPTLEVARPPAATRSAPLPKGVDAHVASVWEQAAQGNGEDDL